MKQIEAVIRKERFAKVDLALRDIGVPLEALTMSEGGGSAGSIWTVTESEGGRTSYAMEYDRRAVISLVVEDEVVQAVVKAIARSAATSSLGDGKIFVFPVEKAIDIASAAIPLQFVR